jgi:hypothetical protein
MRSRSLLIRPVAYVKRSSAARLLDAETANERLVVQRRERFPVEPIAVLKKNGDERAHAVEGDEHPFERRGVEVLRLLVAKLHHARDRGRIHDALHLLVAERGATRRRREDRLPVSTFL